MWLLSSSASWPSAAAASPRRSAASWRFRCSSWRVRGSRWRSWDGRRSPAVAPALTASGAAVAMVALTALSIAWSASGERSWTETNRSLVYVALGTVGALVAAARPDARVLAGVVASVLGGRPRLGAARPGDPVARAGPLDPGADAPPRRGGRLRERPRASGRDGGAARALGRVGAAALGPRGRARCSWSRRSWPAR